MNVADLMMSASNWRLAARLLPLSLGLLLVGFTDGPDGDWYIYDTTFSGDQVVYNIQFTGNGPGNFPHGWTVEED